MNTNAINKTKLPAIISTGSLVFIIILTTFFNPTNHLIAVVLFFVCLYLLLLNVGYLMLRVQNKELSPRSKLRIVMVCTFILTVLMLRSARALSLLDGLILILIMGGLVFYANRR